jgi:hypothetical protein
MVAEFSKSIFCLLKNIVIHSGYQKYDIFKKKITNTVNCESFKNNTQYLVNKKLLFSFIYITNFLFLFVKI